MTGVSVHPSAGLHPCVAGEGCDCTLPKGLTGCHRVPPGGHCPQHTWNPRYAGRVPACRPHPARSRPHLHPVCKIPEEGKFRATIMRYPLLQIVGKSTHYHILMLTIRSVVDVHLVFFPDKRVIIMAFPFKFPKIPLPQSLLYLRDLQSYTV